MLARLAILVLAARVAGAAEYVSRERASELELKKVFKKFAEKHKKNYATLEEFEFRLEVFRQSLGELLDLSAPIRPQIIFPRSGSDDQILISPKASKLPFETSLYSFADLTPKEFEQRYLMASKMFKKMPVKGDLSMLKSDSDPERNKLLEKLELRKIDPFVQLAKADQPVSSSDSSSLFFKTATSKNSELERQALEGIFGAVKDIGQFEVDPEDRKFVEKLSEAQNKGPARRLQVVFPSFFPQQMMAQPLIAPQIFPQQMMPTQIFSQPMMPAQMMPSQIQMSAPFNSASFSSQAFPSLANLQQSIFAPPAAPSPGTPSGPPYNSESVTIAGVTYPTYVNWVQSLSPVKNQGKCNACYAFGAISLIESSHRAKHKADLSLSEQEIVDCSEENNGCVGGQPYLVFQYIMKNGISFAQNYPYEEAKRQCRRNPSLPRYKGLTGYLFLTKGVMAIIRALRHGPVAVIGYASVGLKYYYSGMYEGQGCESGQVPNHTATIYGYNLRAPVPYFMVKNAWGDDWAERGHFKLKIGELSEFNYSVCQFAETPYNVIATVA